MIGGAAARRELSNPPNQTVMRDVDPLSPPHAQIVGVRVNLSRALRAGRIASCRLFGSAACCAAVTASCAGIDATGLEVPVYRRFQLMQDARSMVFIAAVLSSNLFCPSAGFWDLESRIIAARILSSYPLNKKIALTLQPPPQGSCRLVH